MKKLISYVRGERGATSVMVIFMVIVLVTLGAFALTSAASNIVFANRSKAWNINYYELDSIASEFEAKVDSALESAEFSAYAQAENNYEKFNEKYLELAYEAFASLYFEKAETEVFYEEGVPMIIAVFSLSENENYQLHVKIAAITPVYNDDFTKDYIDNQRYVILEWKQYQTPFNYNTGLEYWSPEGLK